MIGCPVNWMGKDVERLSTRQFGFNYSVLRRAALLLIFVFIAAIFAAYPQSVQAHASLERYSPEPNTQLKASPPKVELTFNEAVEAGVGSVQVIDSLSNSVTNAKPAVSQDRRTISLPLPALKEGVYTVAYKIVSIDGHPMTGSYVFVVGNPPGAKDASAFNVHSQLGHSGHGAHGVSTSLTSKAFLTYAIRVLYYAFLLLATGYMLWMALWKEKGESAAAPVRNWGIWLTRGLLIAVLLFVFIHSREVMEYQPASDWVPLFTKTAVGLAWAGAIILSLIGSMVLRAGKWVGVVWALALLALESWSGHAAAYEPKLVTIALDFLHLAASAVWAGGLALLLGLWLTDRKESGRFAATFSKAAWMSLVVLVITGVISTLQFLPKLSYLFYTAWGTLLLIKTAFVALVIVTGFLLRLKVRRGDLPAGFLLKADAVLMALIIVAVGLFTYISPLPANEPVRAHQMGEVLHYTLRVTPNVPGVNEFIVKVWLPETEGKPKSVILRLRSEDKPDMGPIDIPIKAYEDEEIESFTGYVRASYRAEGPFIPFAGKWTAEIRVMDQKDNETVKKESFRNY
jgi:copper transport protein